jgi:hypothetical protein
MGWHGSVLLWGRGHGLSGSSAVVRVWYSLASSSTHSDSEGVLLGWKMEGGGRGEEGRRRQEPLALAILTIDSPTHTIHTPATHSTIPPPAQPTRVTAQQPRSVTHPTTLTPPPTSLYPAPHPIHDRPPSYPYLLYY